MIDDSERRKLIVDLLSDADVRGLSPADRIALRSYLRSLDLESFGSLVREQFDNLTLAEESLAYATDNDWATNVPLQELAESLIFLGENLQATLVAAQLIRQLPDNAEAARLWAMAAPSVEEAVARFRARLPLVADRERLLVGARDFLLRHQRPDLLGGLEG